MIFRPENWSSIKCQKQHFSEGLVHGFCPKIELFSFGFFWCYQLRQKRFFFLYSWQTRMILDQKVNVLKGAKNRHFPKGIIHRFCPKIEIFLICVFWGNQVRKYCFLIFWIKNDFYTRKIRSLKVQNIEICKRG